jgi:GH15 family glucan-1,4-alpha-glucosidase
MFEYGAVKPLVEAVGHSATMTAGPDTLRLWSAVDTTLAGHAVVADFTVSQGQQVSFELVWHPSHEDPPFPIVGQAAVEAVGQFWEEWVGKCTYSGPFRDAVVRSLITLKALTYSPTGGMVAAPTTSLPEYIGGSRNWDYRYCWVRDSALALGAFMRCGYREEAAAWWTWLQRASAGDPGRLQVLYGVAGERHIPERNLNWLDGYRGSRPVRVGNAAAGQAQIDLYGELINAFHNYRATAGAEGGSTKHWEHEVALVEYLSSAWRKPDRSIWEVRDRSRHFTFSKMMAWVAFDRAISDAETYGLRAPLELWRKSRDAIRAEILKRGFDSNRGVFTMAYDVNELDASLLLMPVFGFLPADDPRIVATIDAIASELDLGGLIRRYIPGSPGPKDAEMGPEGVFIPTSFWLVDALALSGRVAEATVRFKRLLGLANDVGLMSEEFDPVAGVHLGNFPQAFSHVALIDSACYLEAATRGDVDNLTDLFASSLPA